MATLSFISLFLLSVTTVQCLYDHSTSDVVELTEANFETRVLKDSAVWIVEFYAPWCGHCKSLAPEYGKAATILKGIAKVGAVDMTQHRSVGAPYNVRGFPTIKIFGADKKSPKDYRSARTAQALTDSAIAEIKSIVEARLGGKAGGDSSGGGRKEESKKPTGDEKDVVVLTDSNFMDQISNSEDMWLVEFYAPWCGHCKNLAPHWAQAATELKGKVKVANLDATVHTVAANRYNIRGFPTIKMFPSGKKNMDSPEEYDGGRTSSDIVQWALNKVAENIPPPEVKELLGQELLDSACNDKQLCVIAILPMLLDCQSKCRNDYLKILKDLGEKYKKNMWGWVWAEATQQSDLEEKLGIGGFGYPAMAVVNYRKMKFSILRGSFSYDGINEFLRDVSYGKGSTAPMKGNELPKIKAQKAWDGKDAEMPKEEEIDLDDEDEKPDKTEL